jgi:transposase-like protein
LGVQYKTAWFMTHRIRHVLHDPVFKGMFDGVVEADETYIGPKKVHGKRGRGAGKKQIVFGLVERGGRVRPVHVQRITGKTLKGIIRDNVKRAAVISTDEFVSYNGLAKEFRGHLRVNHGKKEYVNGEAHVNTAESFWALLKRGVHGIFHHISAKHLHRYLDEFAYRFDTRKGSDGERIQKLLRQVEGKRLLYATPISS